MKLDAVVGNPPYQLIDNGNAASDAGAPIYQKFVDVARKMFPQYISMIMPSKWMVGGRSELTSFLESMKEDVHLSYIKDYRNDRFIFPTAHNDGGICYFRWDISKKTEHVNYTYVTLDGNEYNHNTRLKNNFSPYIIRDMRVLPILEKIYKIENCNKEKNSFSQIVSKTRPFGLRKDLFNTPENYPFSNLQFEPYEKSLKVYGVKGFKGGAKRMVGYINDHDISDKYLALKKYKIFFTTTYSSDAVAPPEFIKGYPNDICTETFLLIGPFKSQKEMDNCASYMETDFFRFLLYLGHGTMQVNKNVFSLIPLQDFNKDWKDETLFYKYKLTDKEIQFLKALIKQ